MSYGLHSKLVEDVFAFAKSNGVLCDVVQQETFPWIVVRNLAEAKRLAWDQDQELLWTDLREQRMSEVWKVTYGQRDFVEVKAALVRNLEPLSKWVKTRLDVQHRELVDDIASDLYNCAVNRAVNGASGFFENLFQAYQAGGWPCGWYGEYPNGHLFVYIRPVPAA